MRRDVCVMGVTPALAPPLLLPPDAPPPVPVSACASETRGWHCSIRVSGGLWWFCYFVRNREREAAPSGTTPGSGPTARAGLDVSARRERGRTAAPRQDGARTRTPSRRMLSRGRPLWEPQAGCARRDLRLPPSELVPRRRRGPRARTPPAAGRALPGTQEP